ncbi:MAG: hypothetical protein HDT28_01200 [Clostridiales bacterium]|nr:hypothetical protein [Clostridiales bacterium]
MANIITLTGASHCGKSFVRQLFIEASSKFWADFKPIKFVKETTRPTRKNDDDVVHVNSISPECDFVYEQYGVRYGFSLGDLYRHLKVGESPIIVVNDVRAVEDLQTAAGDLVVSLFVYRRPPILKAFEDEELTRMRDGYGKEEQEQALLSARTRMEKAGAIHRIYIENIHLFNNVILNLTGEENKTRKQIENIIAKLTKSIEGLVEVDNV